MKFIAVCKRYQVCKLHDMQIIRVIELPANVHAYLFLILRIKNKIFEILTCKS